MTMHCDLDFWDEYTKIKVVNLKTGFSPAVKELWSPQFQNNAIPPARERPDGTIQQDLTSNVENTDIQAEDKLEGIPE